jgi:ABC-2 type transport system permease protein
MAVLPLIFIVAPLIEVLSLPASASGALLSGDPLAILLGIPALVPGTLAAYAVVGERQQGTLEPVLTTPIRREEFLLAKALAAFLPSLAISLLVYAFFLACVKVFAQPEVTSAVFRGPDILAQLLFTPLLAAWSIWVGIAVSSRAGDQRVAQQLSALASLPSVLVIYLVAYNVIPATADLALGLGVLLLVLDALGWRIGSALFDRERLVTGAR